MGGALPLRGDDLQMCDVRVASDNHSERRMDTKIGVKKKARLKQSRLAACRRVQA